MPTATPWAFIAHPHSCFHVLTLNKPELRKTLRSRRQSLSNAEQNSAAHKLFIRIARHPSFTNAQHIACYLAGDGEISPHELIAFALKQGKTLYLPCIQADGTLLFRQLTTNTTFRPNKFGINEPAPKHLAINATELDLALMPLVGFDTQGRRLGMGGGYYDRTFAYKLRHSQRPPVLMGLAHEFQKSDALENDPWDVSLDVVVTEKQTHWLR